MTVANNHDFGFGYKWICELWEQKAKIVLILFFIAELLSIYLSAVALFLARLRKDKISLSGAGARGAEMADCNRGEDYVAPQEEEQGEGPPKQEKYGGLAPRKKPLISKDHERAFFDSADWALCKQGAANQKSTVAVESLRPKLQRSPHRQLPPRRPECTSRRDTQ
ncbi:hypothetical protein Nepgr_031000 [Nepenthes gracilis]|uniref:cAMP-regulated phosphoprotein 19-related protein n=1 Tax=Nepenthes gracilis TaxID=150966 RepID=A0AAD3Y4E2_NEPGR|nr:hypothetical protein Nepgr_031000 [Nepenthes gracilis]